VLGGEKMLVEFTTALNEFAGVIGYSVIILAVVYAAVKVGVTIAKRD